jgi:hypothetical protein
VPAGVVEVPGAVGVVAPEAGGVWAYANAGTIKMAGAASHARRRKNVRLRCGIERSSGRDA